MYVNFNRYRRFWILELSCVVPGITLFYPSPLMAKVVNISYTTSQKYCIEFKGKFHLRVCLAIVSDVAEQGSSGTGMIASETPKAILSTMVGQLNYTTR